MENQDDQQTAGAAANPAPATPIAARRQPAPQTPVQQNPDLGQLELSPSFATLSRDEQVRALMNKVSTLVEQRNIMKDKIDENLDELQKKDDWLNSQGDKIRETDAENASLRSMLQKRRPGSNSGEEDDVSANSSEDGEIIIRRPTMRAAGEQVISALRASRPNSPAVRSAAAAPLPQQPAAAAPPLQYMRPAHSATHKVTLPKFKGKETPNEARQFVADIAMYANLCLLDDAATARAFAQSLSDGARDWYIVTVLYDERMRTSWALIKPKFLERYARRITETERVAIEEKLLQTKDEDVVSFLERCRMAQFQIDVDDEDYNDLSAPAKRRHHDKAVLRLFVKGLRTSDDLKRDVAARTDCKTLEEYLQVAKRIEEANNEKSKKLPGQKAAIVAVIDALGLQNMTGEDRAALEESDPETLRICALLTKNRFNGNRRNNNNGNGGSSNNNGTNDNNGFKKFNGQCDHCNIMGHRKSECRKKETMPQDPIAKKREEERNARWQQSRGTSNGNGSNNWRPRTKGVAEVNNDNGGQQATQLPQQPQQQNSLPANAAVHMVQPSHWAPSF